MFTLIKQPKKMIESGKERKNCVIIVIHANVHNVKGVYRATCTEIHTHL